MKTIIIKTQKELDDLPKSFTEFTEIQIRSTEQIIVRDAWGNSHVDAMDNSHVTAMDNSHVTAWDNSHVTARGNSHVDAWGNSHVDARENSHVVARENSHVVARENSHVVARENSHVVAGGSSIIVVLSVFVAIKQAIQLSKIIFQDCKKHKFRKSKSVIVIEEKKALHDKKSFVVLHNLAVKKNKIILHKSVNPDTLCDFFSGSIKYEGMVTCPDFKADKNIECGNGLHLSPTPELALSFNKGKILKCQVDLKDIVVYPYNIDKVRCRKVKVLGEL